MNYFLKCYSLDELLTMRPIIAIVVKFTPLGKGTTQQSQKNDTDHISLTTNPKVNWTAIFLCVSRLSGTRHNSYCAHEVLPLPWQEVFCDVLFTKWCYSLWISDLN